MLTMQKHFYSEKYEELLSIIKKHGNNSHVCPLKENDWVIFIALPMHSLRNKALFPQKLMFRFNLSLVQIF